MIDDSMKVFSGSSNPGLAKAITDYLGIESGKINLRRFSDGEIFVEIGENVRGKDVYIVQSTCMPVNDNLMELLIIMDALRRASAWKITVVIPYYGYARQDRKVAPRVPISAKLVADLITTAGASRVLTMDLHAGQIQGFFNIPVDNLFAMPIFLDYIRKNFKENLVMASFDVGGAERARAYAKQLDAPFAIIDKRRTGINKSEVMNIVGNVAGLHALVPEDMVDTSGTAEKGSSALINNGAISVHVFSTHAVLSGPALGRINNAPIESLVVTDTIALGEKKAMCPKIIQLPSAPMFGEAIKSIHFNGSISNLFLNK
jgi:ribose-phosphate pyrophosphokinase